MRNQAPVQQVEPKFDLATHKRDKFGKISEISHYRLHIIDGNKGFERPVGSGNLWYENNEPMGRIKKDKNGKVEFDLGAQHIAYVAPLTGDALVAKEAADLKAKNASLEAELAALRAEAKAKTEVKQPTSPEKK